MKTDEAAVTVLAEAIAVVSGGPNERKHKRAYRGDAQAILAALPEGWRLSRVDEVVSVRRDNAELREALAFLVRDVIEAKVSSKSPANLTWWGEVNASLDRAERLLRQQASEEATRKTTPEGGPSLDHRTRVVRQSQGSGGKSSASGEAP